MNPEYPRLLDEFARCIGLSPDEPLCQSGELMIGGVIVNVYYEGDDDLGDVVFFCALGKPDEAHRNDFWQAMLEANYLWIGTGGATFGIHPQTGDVTLCGRMALEMLSGESLASLLDAFADTCAFWRDALACPMDAEQEVADAGDFGRSTIGFSG